MKALFYRCISPDLLEIIKKICAHKSFAHFRLCGGTALALQCGHRISVDADFVSEKKIDANELIAVINQEFKNVSDIHMGTHGLFLKVNDVKTDFLTWNSPFIRPELISDGIRLLNVEEIIAMKLFAILQRGEKKDYMDIASLLGRFSLEEMISFYSERHKGSDGMLILKYLSSYGDIENQPEPRMLNGFTWIDCKKKLGEALKKMLDKE